MSHQSEGYTKGGHPTFRHSTVEGRRGPEGEACTEAISRHIELHLGEIETVFHELVADRVHLDVHVVRPSKDLPFWRLVTSGMSDLPMRVPENAETPRFAELIITLPENWKLDAEAFKEEDWYWPLRLLKGLARLPHLYETWLGWGHTIPNGDPARPYASNTQLSGAIILPSRMTSESFDLLRISADKEIAFLAVVPLYEEEMQYKLDKGTRALIERFEARGLDEAVDPRRPNAVKTRTLPGATRR